MYKKEQTKIILILNDSKGNKMETNKFPFRLYPPHVHAWKTET
jgi:hypothetical protein